jgi:hypothetical protein
MDKLALAEMTCFPGNNKLVLKEVTKKNVEHSSRTKLICPGALKMFKQLPS